MLRNLFRVTAVGSDGSKKIGSLLYQKAAEHRLTDSPLAAAARQHTQ